MAQSQQRKPSWDNDHMINLYIHDYCVKRNFQASASTFASEAKIGPDTKVPYDTPEGFLYEWFVVFWDCWSAGQPQHGTASKDAVLFMEHNLLNRQIMRPAGQHPLQARGGALQLQQAQNTQLQHTQQFQQLQHQQQQQQQQQMLQQKQQQALQTQQQLQQQHQTSTGIQNMHPVMTPNTMQSPHAIHMQSPHTPQQQLQLPGVVGMHASPQFVSAQVVGQATTSDPTQLANHIQKTQQARNTILSPVQKNALSKQQQQQFLQQQNQLMQQNQQLQQNSPLQMQPNQQQQPQQLAQHMQMQQMQQVQSQPMQQLPVIDQQILLRQKALQQQQQQMQMAAAAARAAGVMQGADPSISGPNGIDPQVDPAQDRKRIRNNSAGAFSPQIGQATHATPLQHNSALMAANVSSPNMIGSPTTPAAQPAAVPEAPVKSNRRRKGIKKEQSVDPSAEAPSATTPAGQFSMPPTPSANGFASPNIPNIQHQVQQQAQLHVQQQQVPQQTTQLIGQPQLQAQSQAQPQQTPLQQQQQQMQQQLQQQQTQQIQQQQHIQQQQQQQLQQQQQQQLQQQQQHQLQQHQLQQQQQHIQMQIQLQRAQQQQQLAAMAGINPNVRPVMVNVPVRPGLSPTIVPAITGAIQSPLVNPQMPGMMTPPQLQARLQQQQRLQMQLQYQAQQVQQHQQLQQQHQLFVPQQQGTPGPQTPQDSSQIKNIQSPIPQNSLPNGLHGQADSLTGGPIVAPGQDLNQQHVSSPTPANQVPRDRMNSMHSPGNTSDPTTPMNAGSPTNRARATQQQFHAQHQEAQKKQQQSLLWNRQQGQVPADGPKQQLQRQTSMLTHQQMMGDGQQDYVGSPNSTSQAATTPATIISPVSSGMESMSMNIGGVDEIGRIQSLLTDNSEFEHIDNDGLQMDDMGVDPYGNVNLLSLGRNEEMQLSSPHDSQLQLLANLQGHAQKVNTCAFSFNGQWLASAGVDKKILIWSVLEKELKCTIEPPEGHSGHIINARFCSDDRLILGTTSIDTTVRIWDLAPLAQGTSTTIKALQVLKGHNMHITAVDFCPSVGSNHCVSCDGDGELRLWDFMTGQCKRTIKMSSKPIFSHNPVRYHPQNPNIVAVAMGTMLYMVHINDLKSEPRSINTTHSKSISTLDWSAQGNFLVTVSDDQVSVWDTTQPTQWRVLKSQQSPKISSCSFLKSLPTGSTTAAAQAATTRLVYGDYEKIWIWAFNASGYMGSAPVADPQAHPGAAVTALACTVTSLDSSGESSVVLASTSAGKDGNLKLWRVPG